MSSAVYCTGGFDNAINDIINTGLMLKRISENQFLISSKYDQVINAVKLHDIKGSELFYIKDLNTKEYVMDLTLAEKGIYILRVYTDLGSSGFKLNL